MNRQSDYGYSLGGIEHRTRELCLRRAAYCDQLAADYPDDNRYSRWAQEWRTEAETLA